MDWATILSIVFGGLITFGASYYFYQKSAEELKGQSEKLRKTLKVLARWHQNTGQSEDEFRFDDEGNLVGLRQHSSVELEGKAHLRVNAEVISRADKAKKRD